jgi:hypothetical protein
VPEKVAIDWEKIDSCPCCRQKMPENKNQINREFMNYPATPTTPNINEETSKSRIRM